MGCYGGEGVVEEVEMGNSVFVTFVGGVGGERSGAGAGLGAEGDSS